MDLEKNVQTMVELERHVRSLDTLIQHVGSMNDEELKDAWPRILKASRTLELHGMALTPYETSVALPVFLFDEGNLSFCERFWRRLSNVQLRMKTAFFFRMSSRQQETSLS